MRKLKAWAARLTASAQGVARLHLNKRGMRVLGVAESFREGQARSTLAGVVMRGDLVVDGFALGSTSVGGSDATRSLAALYRSLKRGDINLLMLSGCIISKYNIVDVDALARRLELPVVCLTYNETAGIAEALAERFPGDQDRLLAYQRLGSREALKLPSGHRIFVRASGMELKDAAAVLGMFTLQGSVPEPVRVARLLARAVSRRSSRRDSRATSGRRSASRAS
ncbi:MAG TPA: DUF99 family protein [Nitrososphaerales archaeon]|nr:DUF99 family protein [Nitrososphaerales archaeon]